MQPDEILAPLDPDQRAVAQAVAGPVVVLAGAGTGKTRALTHRVAYGVATGAMDPRRVLVVTFTTRAAGEFGSAACAPWVSTMCACARCTPRRCGNCSGCGRGRWVVRCRGSSRRRSHLVSTALSNCGIRLDDAGRRDVTGEIERAKAVGLAPEQAGDQGVIGDRLARVYQEYEDVKGAAGVVDFEDILLLNAGLIRENPTIAEQVRQWCRWITVDEYQDVSPLQQQVIEGWLGGRDELCVVGDPSQTIYSFAGARSDFLLGFNGRWPESTSLRLTHSYRCARSIIDLANAVLAQGEERGRLRLASERDVAGEVRTTVYDTEYDEAAGVAERIKGLLRKTVPASQIAILVRINSMTARFERELQAAGIPYSVRGSARFMQRPEVKRAVSLLRVASKHSSEADVAEQAAAALEPVGYSPKPPLGQAQREEWESLAALVSLAGGHATMTDLVADLDERAANDDAPVADAVTLASLHSAKGLEWQAVFMPGAYEGGLASALPG